MFETVVPETAAPRSRRLFYETLPVSLTAHALVVAGMFAGTIWKVSFPTNSPAMVAAYQLAAAPPPPPPPPPPPAGRSAPVQTKVPIRMPDVAPTIIPDVIPEVAKEVPADLPVVEGPPGVPGGVEGGVEGGVLGGTIGGVVTDNAVAPPPPPPPDVIEVPRDAPLPVEIITREKIQYPAYAQWKNWEDTLVVRYVIGKDGRVKSVTVLQPPQHEQFTKATVNTMKGWRFEPFRDENGVAKEVVHEVTVEFRLIRKAGTA